LTFVRDSAPKHFNTSITVWHKNEKKVVLELF